MRDLQLIATTPWFWFSLFLAVLSLSLALWQYAARHHQLSARLRLLLKGLRIASWFILAFLIFQPVIQFFRYNREKPVDIALIDQSLSIGQSPGFMASRLYEKINLALEDYQTLDHEILYYGFGSQLTRLSSLSDVKTIHYDQKTTNIEQALDDIGRLYPEKNINNLFIVTDGQFNGIQSVERNFERYPFNYYLLGIGDTSGVPDVCLNDIQYDPIMYLGETSHLKIQISTENIPETRGQLIVKDENGQVLTKQPLQLNKGTIQREIPVEITPGHLGKQFFHFSISTQLDESVIDNNHQAIHINVLKNRLKILVVWGIPHYDLKFLLRSLKTDKNLNIDHFVLSNPTEHGDWISNWDRLADYDLVIMGHCSQSDLTPQQWEILNNFVDGLKKPFILFNGFRERSMTTWQSELRQNILPIVREQLVSERFQGDLRLVPDVINAANTFLDIYGFENDNLRFWEGMPPLNECVLTQSIPSFYKILARVYRIPDADDQENLTSYPAMILNQSNKKKILVSLAAGYWRFSFASLSYQAPGQEMNNLWINMVRYMTFLGNEESILIAPEKPVNYDGIPVVFRGRLLSDSLASLADRVELTIQDTSGQEIATYKMQPNQSQQYETSLLTPSSGKFSYHLIQYRNDQKVAEKKDYFMVLPYNMEKFKLGQNNRLLRSLTQVPGINYQNLETESALSIDSIKSNFRSQTEKQSVTLWDQWPFLLLIIILLTVEWFIRQRNLLM